MVGNTLEEKKEQDTSAAAAASEEEEHGLQDKTLPQIEISTFILF